MVLGVPILKHFRVVIITFMHCAFQYEMTVGCGSSHFQVTNLHNLGLGSRGH